jgi:hypothetical protein
MPDPPDVNLFTHYIFENPYPLTIGLAALGIVLGWLGLRDGRTDRLQWAVVPLLLAAATFITGLIVTTAGEQARAVTRKLIDAGVENDLVTAVDLLSDDVTFHFAKPENPGYDKDFIIEGLDWLTKRFTIEKNSITMLKAYTESSTKATVHAACFTELAEGYGYPSPSQWVLEVERQDDGEWKVTDLTCVSIAGNPPPGARW